MALPIIGQENHGIDPGPVMRLLYCNVCDSFEELPAFFGKPENDHLLQISIEKHKFPSGEEHVGRLYIFPQAHWDRFKKDIIEQIRGRSGGKGLASADPEYYNTQNTFKEDAMKCFNQHFRPTEGCSDYESPSKRLLPQTRVDRKALGLPSPMNAPGPKVFLCHFCPVHSKVTERKRLLRGDYK